SGAGTIERFDRHQPGVVGVGGAGDAVPAGDTGDAGVIVRLRGGDAGAVRAVAEVVGGRPRNPGERVVADDVAAAIAQQLAGEVRVRVVDAGIDDRQHYLGRGLPDAPRQVRLHLLRTVLVGGEEGIVRRRGDVEHVVWL